MERLRSALLRLTLVVSLMVTGAAPAVAVELCRFDDPVLTTRPNPEEGPTEVRVGVFVFDLVDIDTKNQEFVLDFLLQGQWQDPRLGEALRASGREACRTPPDDVWRPNMIPVNSRSLRAELPTFLHVRADGTVQVRQRLVGTFAAELDLSEFPRDSQTLPITFISLEHGPEELGFVFASGGTEAEFSEKGWQVGRPRTRAGAYVMEALRHEGGQDLIALARFDYLIDVSRRPAYYVWKVFLPLCLIVAISWAVFWIDPSHLGVQTGIGTGMTLTIVAFLFSLQRILPNVPYLTRMDIFAFTSLGFVFLAFVESLVSCTMAANGKPAAARRLDRWSRPLFPIAFAVAVANLWWN